LYRIRPKACAFIRQYDTLRRRFSVFYNLYLGRPQRRTIVSDFLNFIKPQASDAAEIWSALHSVGMAEKMGVKVGRLSAQERQRVAAAMAVYQDRPILLADEPMASAAAPKAEEIVRLITTTEKKTVVMALHSVELSLKYATRVVGLCAGTIRFDLSKDQVTPDHITALYVEC
jgi:phosphonate transport system ATP-binding protein